MYDCILKMINEMLFMIHRLMCASSVSLLVRTVVMLLCSPTTSKRSPPSGIHHFITLDAVSVLCDHKNKGEKKHMKESLPYIPVHIIFKVPYFSVKVPECQMTL